MPERDDYPWVRITGAATTIVVGAASKLICINVSAVGGQVIAYNAATSATASTSSVIGGVASSAIVGTYLSGGKKLSTGLTVVTFGASTDVTVVYATA
jgi:hypothetical protein